MALACNLLLRLALLGSLACSFGPACTGGSGEGAPDAADDPLVESLTCNSGPVSMPDLDKSCATASDCALAIHQIDCCGNAIAVGINASASDAFFDAEADCAADFPLCGCASTPPVAEDGMQGSPQQISVACTEDRCVSYVVVDTPG